VLKERAGNSAKEGHRKR